MGVSGGPDSICLLDLLHQNGYLVIAAHLDHQLRNESGAEARRVAGLAESLGVKFVSEACDVCEFSAEYKYSIEQAGRIARYRFLFRQAETFGAQAVAVGHNADDQAETVLMHFLQGSGLDGLSGMKDVLLPNPWNESVPLVRPLLSTSRTQIMEYCRARGLEPILDASNQDPKYFRNRLRVELIPQLEAYVPDVKQKLTQMAAILTADQTILDDMTAAARKACVLEQWEGFVRFDALKFMDQPLGVRRRLVRWAFSALSNDRRELDFHAVQRALSVFQKRGSPRQDVASGVSAVLEDDIFYLASQEADWPTRQWPQLPAGEDFLKLDIPGAMLLAAGWKLVVRVFEGDEGKRKQALENQDPFRAWLAVEGQVPTLHARIRQKGERFYPFGMGGKSKKISDIMVDLKIPRRARARWPLICLDEEVIWLPGYCQAYGTGIKPESSRILFMQIIPPK